MEQNNPPVLFEDARECCGCGSCAAACPKGAIELKEDEFGFLFPSIDSRLCIQCGICKRVCGFQNLRPEPSSGPFLAAASQSEKIVQSASGGVFGALSRGVISQGGIVVGCGVTRADRLRVEHKVAFDRSALNGMYGSRYVQSQTNRLFAEIRLILVEGKEVLFSGTPCQVAGLKGYLGKDYENLLTVDLVCHGVPNMAMLDGYLDRLEVREGSRVVDLGFRTKRDGWRHSLLLRVNFENGSKRYIKSFDSSYYDCFLHLFTLRDSCYSCPFAGRLRPADISIGDFWGVEQLRPDLLTGAGGRLDVNRGISCVLVNSDKGLKWLHRFGGELVTERVAFEDISKMNDQLRHPSICPKERADYLDAYVKDGWDGIERIWKHDTRGEHAKRIIKSFVPKSVKHCIKSLVSRTDDE